MRTPLCALAALVATVAAGCEKEPPPESGAAVNVLPSARIAAANAAFGETADVEPPAAAAEPAKPGADQIAARVAPGVNVDEALVRRYLTYRLTVVERGEAAVEAFQKARAERSAKDKAAANAKKPAQTRAAAVVAQQVTEAFATQMRKIEEDARNAAGLSREQVAAVGQVVGEVLSARQIWRMSGGDEAVANAKASLVKLSSKERAAAQTRLARTEAGFAEMKEARSARGRFGDAAVDAVLKHEDALWKVQKDGARVMAAVY